MDILKQALGIDVAKDELVVSLGRMYKDLTIEIYSTNVFSNNQSGFKSLMKWVNQQTETAIKIQFVMEATGVYHQKFAYFLDEEGCNVSIVMPNKISNYMRTLEIKTITDNTCAKAIAQFGLERKLDLWKRPNPVYKKLQQLTRERDQIVSERVAVKNQLHAEKTEAEPHQNSIKRLNARIVFLNKQEAEIKKDIKIIISKEETIKKEIENICTIPGVGELTAATILGETNGFELIRNKKQLVSYAGLDIKEKQSGTSVRGIPKISKKGNRTLRKSLHLPAITSIKYNQNHRELFARIVSKNGIKMKGVVAVQRKILELIYTLHKNKTCFEHNYEKREQLQVTASLTN
jgi:transposase